MQTSSPPPCVAESKTNGVKCAPRRTLAICNQFVTATTAGQSSVLNQPGKSPMCIYAIHDLLKAMALVWAWCAVPPSSGSAQHASHKTYQTRLALANLIIYPVCNPLNNNCATNNPTHTRAQPSRVCPHAPSVPPTALSSKHNCPVRFDFESCDWAAPKKAALSWTEKCHQKKCACECSQ